jgi:hypothetical protein
MNFSAAWGVEFAAICAAAGTIITTLESFWHWSRGHYDDGGIWPWSIVRETYKPGVAAALTPLMGNRALPALLSVRLAGAAAVPLCYAWDVNPATVLALLIATQVTLRLRARWGGEGADQMTMLVLITAFAAAVVPAATTAAALFIGGQISLSYVASGTAKLFGPLWRKGNALRRIMNQHQYGHPGFADLLTRHRWLGAAMNYGIIAFQVSFPLFYLLPMPYALIYPLGGIMFHLGIAWFMRLNLFFVTFVGTYPCLIFTHEWVRHLLFGAAAF